MLTEMTQVATHSIRTRPRAAGVLPMVLALGVLVLSGNIVPAQSAAAASKSGSEGAVSAEAAESAAGKLQQILDVSRGAGALVRFTEAEVNSYLFYELASRYPRGVSKINVRFTPGHLQGTCEVDFEKLRAARRSPGGMMDYLFFGVHTLAVEGGFSAVGGTGQFDLQTVELDGVPLPRMLVDFLIDTYLRPRFPTLALDSPFRMPYSIDRVQVGRASIEVEAKPPAAIY